MAKKKSKKKSAKSSAASVVKAIQDWSESKLDEKPKIYTPAQVKKLGVTPAPSAVGVMLTEDGYFLPRAMADMYDSDAAYDMLDAFSSYLDGLGYTWTGLEDDPYGTWYEIIPLTANPRKAPARKKAAVRWKKWMDPWRAKEYSSVQVGSTSVLVTVDASEPGPTIFRWGVLPAGKKEKTGTEPSLDEAKARALEVASAPTKKKAKKKAKKKNPGRGDILRRAMRGT